LWEAGRKGCEDSSTPWEDHLCGVLASCSQWSHTHARTQTLHGSTINIAITFLYTQTHAHMPSHSGKIHDTQAWSFTPPHRGRKSPSATTPPSAAFVPQTVGKNSRPQLRPRPNTLCRLLLGIVEVVKRPLLNISFFHNSVLFQFTCTSYSTVELAADACFMCKQCLKYPVQKFDH